MFPSIIWLIKYNIKKTHLYQLLHIHVSKINMLQIDQLKEYFLLTFIALLLWYLPVIVFLNRTHFYRL